MSTTHPQVGAYLDDLARMLVDIDPAERDDILASVREHLDTEIGSGDGGDAVVHAALLRLGPAERVAAEARAGQVPSTSGRTNVAVPSRGGAATARVAVVTTLLSTLPFALLALWARTGALGTAEATGGPASGGMFGATPSSMVFLIVLGSPLWLVGLVCTLVAGPLTPRTRRRLALVGPAAFVGTVAGASWWSPSLLSGVVSVGLLVAVCIGVVRVAREAWQEAGA